MISFAHPEHLYWLLALPGLAALYWFAWWRRMRTIRRYGAPRPVLRMVEGRSRVKYWLKAGLLLTAWAALILAAANPRVGTRYEEVKRTGIDLIVAVDVSASMKAQDIRPSRMDAARRELLNLINKLQGDRIGLVVFSGDAYTQLPLTTDYNAALMLSDVITTGIAPRPGTAIGSAIELARASFRKDEGKYKALVIITDGENHEDDAVSAAKDAADDGIIIHTIGMGSPGGAPIPTTDGEYKKDGLGQPVLTRLDEGTLEEVATATGGTYTRAVNGRDNLATVFDRIARMEKQHIGTKQFTAFEDRFQFPVALALLLLLSELFLSETRNRWLARFALFAPPEEQA